jgi:Na+/H+ antiporter NhaC
MTLLDPNKEPTPREVLIALNAHVQSCALFQKINLGFISAMLAGLVVFAGYTYAHNQAMYDEQLAAVQKASVAADQTRAVAQTVGAPITPDPR